MAVIGRQTFGAIVIGLGILVNVHWYIAHLTKYFAGDDSQLIPELAVAVVSLYIIGIALISKKLSISK
jgi:hypothetical protein